MSQYRVGIVGLRGIASRKADESLSPLRREIIVSHSAAIALVHKLQIVGYCDLVPDLREEFGAVWGEQFPNANPYDDYKDMINRERLDILTIATGDDKHAPIVIAAAEAGVRGIFCEKPLATTMRDAKSMVKVCEENDVVLVVDHTRRWDPSFHAVRKAIRDGDIGGLTTIIGTLGGPRAMLFRNGTHLIDAICFFAESSPSKVFARLEDGFDHWDEYKGDGGKSSQSEPGATGYIEFRNGVRAFYNGVKNTHSGFGLQLSGSSGQIRIDGGSCPVLITSGPDGENSYTQLTPPSFSVHGLPAAYEELVGLIENGGEGVSMAGEAMKTVEIMTGFLRSHQAGSVLVEIPD